MKQLNFSALVYACCMVSQAHISPAFAHSWGEKKRGCTADHAGPKKKVRTSSYIIHFLLLLSDFFFFSKLFLHFPHFNNEKKLDLTDVSFECTRKLKLDQFFLDYISVPVKVICYIQHIYVQIFKYSFRYAPKLFYSIKNKQHILFRGSIFYHFSWQT